MAIKREEWENRYEEIKNMPEVPTNERLEEELKGKEVQFAQRLAQIKDTTSQEYKDVISERNQVRREYEKSMKDNEFLRENFAAIRSNFSLIDKARENRNTYQEILDEILESKAENERKIEERARLGKEAERLEAELAELKYHEEHLLIAVNNQEVTEEQRAQAALRLEEIRKKLSKNHSDFSANQNALEEQLKAPLIDIVDGDIEELQSKIDRCNKTCELLLEGKSMGEVQKALGEEKTQKAKAQKPAEPKEPVKPVEQKAPEPKKPVQPTPEQKAPEPEKTVEPKPEPKAEEKPVQEEKPQEPVTQEEEKPQQPEEPAQNKYEISEEKANRLKMAINEMRGLGISDESIRSYIFAKDTGVIHSEEELNKLHEVGEKHGVYDIMAEDWIADNGSHGYSKEMYALVAGVLGKPTLEKTLKEQEQRRAEKQPAQENAVQPVAEKAAEQPAQEKAAKKPKVEEPKKTITIDEVANRLFKILNDEDKKSIREDKNSLMTRLQNGHTNWYEYMGKLPLQVVLRIQDIIHDMCLKEQSKEKQPAQEKAQQPKAPAQKTPQPAPKAPTQQPAQKSPDTNKADKKSNEVKTKKILPQEIRWTSIFVGKNGSAMDIETATEQDMVRREYTPLTKTLKYEFKDGISHEMVIKARKIGDPMVIREILFNDKLSIEAKKGLLHYYTKMIELRKEDPNADIEKYSRILDLQYDVRGLRKSGLSKQDQQKVLKKAKEARDLGIADVKTGPWIAARWGLEDLAERIGFRVWDSQNALEAPEEHKPTTAERKSKKDMDEKYRVENAKDEAMDAEYERVGRKPRQQKAAVVDEKMSEAINGEIEQAGDR